uniref:Ubiquitin-like domain-containing protein n=1 Tax=Solanum demissum TaxID=50514 RepID=Q0KIL5_SOLDE|nr:hypothetical protein SDM1_53t00013 [Solanum demissum]
MDGTKEYRNRFALMVDPGNTIVVVKAYIQEEKHIPFKKQRLLSKDGKDLSDAQTLFALGIKKGMKNGSTLILRYEPISSNKFTSCIFNIKVQRNDTVGDLKAIFQEMNGIRFPTVRSTYRGQILDNDKRLVDLDN